MRRSIVDYSIREIAFRLLMKGGLQTRSEAHQSVTDLEISDSTCTPLLISGLPRSGTTTILHSYARSLNYNALFEPLVFNHLEHDDAYFKKVSACFRANPGPHELALQDVASGLFSDLIKIEDEQFRSRATQLLESIVSKIVNLCGRGVVIKELRWIANLDIVDELFTESNSKPRHVLIDPDPYMVLYTHYRLGGLVEGNDFNNLAVNEMYERKIRIARMRDYLSGLCRYMPANKWEKLLISILIDRELMRRFAEVNSGRTHFGDFEELMNNQCEILTNLGYSPTDSKTIINPSKVTKKRFADDPYFRRRVEENISTKMIELVENYSNATTISWSGLSRPGKRRRFFTHLAVLCVES